MDLLPNNRVYVVGGCVRKLYEDEPYGDLDMVTDAKPEEIEALKAKHGLDIYRQDLGNGKTLFRWYIGRTPIDLITNNTINAANDQEWLQQDALKRDFTINALYLDRHNQMHAPLKTSIMDLDARNIVLIDPSAETFGKDDFAKIKLLRALCLAESSDYHIPDDLQKLLNANKNQLSTIPCEKLHSHMKKLFLTHHACSHFIRLRDAGFLEFLFPTIANDRFKKSSWLMNQLHNTDETQYPSLEYVYSAFILASLKKPSLSAAIEVIENTPIFKDYFATRDNYHRTISAILTRMPAAAAHHAQSAENRSPFFAATAAVGTTTHGNGQAAPNTHTPHATNFTVN